MTKVHQDMSDAVNILVGGWAGNGVLAWLQQWQGPLRVRRQQWGKGLEHAHGRTMLVQRMLSNMHFDSDCNHACRCTASGRAGSCARQSSAWGCSLPGSWGPGEPQLLLLFFNPSSGQGRAAQHFAP